MQTLKKHLNLLLILALAVVVVAELEVRVGLWGVPLQSAPGLYKRQHTDMSETLILYSTGTMEQIFESPGMVTYTHKSQWAPAPAPSSAVSGETRINGISFNKYVDARDVKLKIKTRPKTKDQIRRLREQVESYLKSANRTTGQTFQSVEVRFSHPITFRSKPNRLRITENENCVHLTADAGPDYILCK